MVEDDAIIALRNYELLTKAGYAVPHMFASGEEREGPPDLILMDIGLSGKIDGLETARRVRTCCNVPFIFLSSYSDDRRRAKAQEISPDRFLVKPIHEPQLMGMIGEVLGQPEAFGQKR